MPFKEGKSGNPRGLKSAVRTKQKQIRELLAAYVPEAVEAVGKMLKKPEHMQFAVKEVLDRVYGKAPQSIEFGEETKQAMTAVLQVMARTENK